MTFKKGESGNSSGRPKGATGKKLNTFRQAIESRGEELINKALALALEGDTSMIKLCIDRILPAIKPKDEPIELHEMASKRNLAAKAKYVVDAVAVWRDHSFRRERFIIRYP